MSKWAIGRHSFAQKYHGISTKLINPTQVSHCPGVLDNFTYCKALPATAKLLADTTCAQIEKEATNGYQCEK